MTDMLRTTLSLTLTTAWVGAALLLATTVAPAAFDALPSRTMAGDVVGRVLPVIFLSGMAVGVVAAVLAAPESRVRAGSGLVIALACAIAQLAVAPRIARLRDEIGGAVEVLAADDARRQAFGRLHAISVGWLGLAMLAALVLVILSILALRQRA